MTAALEEPIKGTLSGLLVQRGRHPLRAEPVWGPAETGMWCPGKPLILDTRPPPSGSPEGPVGVGGPWRNRILSTQLGGTVAALLDPQERHAEGQGFQTAAVVPAEDRSVYHTSGLSEQGRYPIQ
ncbi:hypothetical protein NDU88_006624 [Pleurodeles waltl]|uniref:Uncharacterized protein n=1 Tax=Pleurodeles waltl TaxID=8319 RepID=A0AAV7LAS4_PLEWA|nr:hypothetical protein NDU88_006624 [Pleurodeles waltl]